MKNEIPQRHYRGSWFSVELHEAVKEWMTKTELLILMEINALSSLKRGCFATNEYLAKECNTTPIHVSRSIKKLKETGWVTEEKGTLNGIKNWRFLYANVEKTPRRKSQKPIPKKEKGDKQKYQPMGKQKCLPEDNSNTTYSYSPNKSMNSVSNETLSASAGADTRRGVSFSSNGNGKHSKTCERNPSKQKEHSKPTPAGSTSQEMAKILHDALLKKNKVMRKPNLSRWASEFSKLHQGRPLKIKRIKKVLKWYCKHFMDEFIPKCFSAASFCSRFVSIEFAMESKNKKESNTNGKLFRREDGMITHKMEYWD